MARGRSGIDRRKLDVPALNARGEGFVAFE